MVVSIESMEVVEVVGPVSVVGVGSTGPPEHRETWRNVSTKF